MGLGSFVDINIFVMIYYFIWFLHILHFFESLQSRFTQMLRPQKGNSGVSFNDTLLNFGLWSVPRPNKNKYHRITTTTKYSDIFC